MRPRPLVLRTALPLAVALLAAAAAPCQAILIRADRDDAEYIELAARYPSSLRIGAAGGEGVLIAPRWILTTASAVSRLPRAKPRDPLAIGAHANAIQAIFVHPAWRQGAEADIALVFLQHAVDGIAPTPVRPDADEIDEVVFIVGHGETGPIGGGTRRTDGRKRAGINTVDKVTATTLRLRIKPLPEASDLQGAVGRDELGAPAILERNAAKSIVGLYSGSEGEWQVFTRVSAYMAWVDETMYKAALEEATSMPRSGAPAKK
jgi:hypothetical protein